MEPSKLYDTLKATVFKNATNEELLALVVVANTYDLSPLLKEIYAFPAKGGGIVPVVSVDGWNRMLVRQPDFDGIQFEFEHDNEGKPITCTATIHVKNRAHPVIVTEYFDECYRNTDPWNKMPHRMLRNRTLCQASRVAFGFSGVKHEEEAIDVESIPMPAEPLKAIAPAKPEPKPEPAPAGNPEQSPQAQLESAVVTAGFTFSTLQQWGEATGNIDGASSLPDFASIPTDVARRLLRNQAGLLKGLAEGVKG